MPYTTIVAGTTITASWANASVRDQVVTPFASSAARSSAVTAPVEGMLSYLSDSDAFEFYDGTTWKRSGHHVPHSKTTRVTIASGSRTATTYAAIPTACQVSFTKHRADSKILARIDATCYASVASGKVFMGVSDGTTDTDCAVLWFNTANQHQALCGEVDLGALSAGAKTFSVKWKVDSGVTANTDGNDFAMLTITETLD